MLNKNIPLVSIIIPLYNAEVFIAQTIQSVLDQTFMDWELIIVDDCSTDRSTKIVNQFAATESRITLIESAINFGGPAKPRNIGIENARGEYITFLDADDIWLPGKLEKQLEFIQTNNLNFSSCYCTLIDEQSKEVPLGWISTLIYKMFSKKTTCDVIKNNFILTSSVIIAKELLFDFNENKDYIAVEDFDLWLRILVEQKTAYRYQDENLIQYRLVNNSISERTSELRQELKANLVLAKFLLDNKQYIWCYLQRLFFHIFLKQFKRMS
jgi:teichuronic acid biosynthesis glycosyltransferase TuaG